jgi:hypothetical protein
MAQHLKSVGAVLYVSEFCDTCKAQQALFGDAAQHLDIVICFGPMESDPQSRFCMDKGIYAVPMWEIGGELHLGHKTLDELAQQTGFHR